MKPDVVVLSAGRGSRIGVSKGLVPYRGRSWIETQMAWLHERGFGNPIVVLGFDHDRYPLLPSAVVEVNSAPERGPFSSLVTGLSRCLGDVFVLPVDVPCPQKETWDALRNALTSGVNACVPAIGGHGGHPVLMSAEYVAHLRRLSPEAARLDHELKKLPPEEFRLVEVCDPRVGINLNEASDWSF